MFDVYTMNLMLKTIFIL